MSIRPNRSIVAAIRALMLSSWARSSGWAMAEPPDASISAATEVAPAMLMSASTTDAPAPASARAQASPMFAPEPETIATRPFRFPNTDSISQQQLPGAQVFGRDEEALVHRQAVLAPMVHVRDPGLDAVHHPPAVLF